MTQVVTDKTVNLQIFVDEDNIFERKQCQTRITRSLLSLPHRAVERAAQPLGGKAGDK